MYTQCVIKSSFIPVEYEVYPIPNFSSLDNIRHRVGVPRWWALFGVWFNGAFWSCCGRPESGRFKLTLGSTVPFIAISCSRSFTNKLAIGWRYIPASIDSMQLWLPVSECWCWLPCTSLARVRCGRGPGEVILSQYFNIVCGGGGYQWNIFLSWIWCSKGGLLSFSSVPIWSCQSGCWLS